MNYKYLQLGVYLVRTQAGLKQAVNHFKDGEEHYSDTYHFGSIYSYPAVVTMSIGYSGNQYIQCSWVHVNDMKNFIKGE